MTCDALTAATGQERSVEPGPLDDFASADPAGLGDNATGLQQDGAMCDDMAVDGAPESTRPGGLQPNPTGDQAAAKAAEEAAPSSASGADATSPEAAAGVEKKEPGSCSDGSPDGARERTPIIVRRSKRGMIPLGSSRCVACVCAAPSSCCWLALRCRRCAGPRRSLRRGPALLPRALPRLLRGPCQCAAPAPVPAAPPLPPACRCGASRCCCLRR